MPEDEPGADEEATAGGGAVHRQAATFRRRLRAAETERDALAERLRATQVREIERLAGERLAAAEDLWTRISFEELLDEDGSVDYSKLSTVIDETLEARPHWRRRPVTGDADQGARRTASAQFDFAGMLRQAARD